MKTVSPTFWSRITREAVASAARQASLPVRENRLVTRRNFPTGLSVLRNGRKLALSERPESTSLCSGIKPHPQTKMTMVYGSFCSGSCRCAGLLDREEVNALSGDWIFRCAWLLDGGEEEAALSECGMKACCCCAATGSMYSCCYAPGKYSYSTLVAAAVASSSEAYQG